MNLDSIVLSAPSNMVTRSDCSSFIVTRYTLKAFHDQAILGVTKTTCRDQQERMNMKGKRMNPSYRSYTQDYPSQVIFRHDTQLFRGCYSCVPWTFHKMT